MKPKLPKLDARLAAALAFVRRGSKLADVGTDHAYLPIYLMLTGKISAAVATDINEGPICRASAHIAAAGLSGKIRTVCTDGLHGLADERPDDIIIFGMGGDLITRIIAEAPFLRTAETRLILQPMTHAETVRKYLSENGWRITDETLARTDRLYQIICADYDGVPYELTAPEEWLGPCNLCKRDALFDEFLNREMRILTVRRDGKQSAGDPAAYETALLAEMEKYI